MPDMYTQTVLVAIVICAPDRRTKGIVGNDVSPVLCQFPQQRQFGSGQRQCFALRQGNNGIIVVLWVGGLAPADPEELANGYSALLYSLPVIEAILMPVMMAVLASRLWDMEIKGNTAKLLYTLQSRRSLFAGKAVFGVLEVLLVTVLELACVPVLGRVHGYTEAFPTGQLVYLFVCTLAVDAMLFFGEFLLMLWVGNPLPALCVGIVGALVGLFSAFMPPLASYFVPFGYYIPLSAYEVANWDQATHTVTYGTRPFNWVLLAFTLALGAVLFALAWRKVQDEEV